MGKPDASGPDVSGPDVSGEDILDGSTPDADLQVEKADDADD